MIFNRPFLPALGVICLLLGCSTAPLVIDSTHPASVDAPEASEKPIPNSLGPDAATQRTQSLLAERQRQARAEESAAPEDLTDLTPKAASSTPSSSDGAPSR
jgi:hypothetical protein